MINKIISALLNYIPTSNIITFNSYPDFTDNAYAMFSYLQSDKYLNKYKMIWLLNDKSQKQKIRDIVKKEGYVCKVINKMSLLGIWYYARCRYCFYTHGILSSFPLKQHKDKMINLWHGMPLKRIGLTDGVEEYNNIDYLLASSNFFKKIMSECFGVVEERVLPIGLPRCDLFFEPTDFYKQKGIRKEKYDKIGIWLPTYRCSIVKTELRQDGDYVPGTISFLNEDGLAKLDEDLKKLNHLMIIKLHPMDKSQLYNFRTYNNILIVKQCDFNVQLYPLLGSTDYLLTDFSSVCIDYDILQKPMGFTISDYDSYLNSRGFVFNDVLSVLPGQIINNYSELLEFIKAPTYKSSSIDFNRFKDNKSRERLAQFLNI